MNVLIHYDQQQAGFIIDLDGTVYAGDSLIAGALEAIHFLQKQQIPFVFLSNRGNYSREMCRAKLEAFGIHVALEQIVLSSSVTAQYLARNYPNDLLWTLGDEGLALELTAHQLALAPSPEQAQWLVITLHEHVTYDDLNDAFRAARAGARIIATNKDRTFPRQDGDCIDVAGMIGAIAYSTGKEPELVVGKPSAMMADAAIEQLSLLAEQCIVIGDSLPSDIQLANHKNMQSVLVLTGSTTKEQAEASEWKPTWIAPSLWSFIQHYYQLGAVSYV